MQIARAMGVGESSVKRWIDAGTLPAEKTPGGHRRVAVSDFYLFLRASGRKLVAPEVLGLAHEGQTESELLEACQRSLKAGDHFALESALQLIRLNEPSAAAAMDRIVYPAYRAIRATCEHPSQECLVLHRGMAMVQLSLSNVMAPLNNAEREAGPRVVFADVGYDVDGLPTHLAEAAVWDMAQTLQLGTNVPTPVVEGALDAFKARVLWLSASGPSRRGPVAEAFDRLLSRAAELKVKVVAFGDAVPAKVDHPMTRVASFAEFRGFMAAVA